MLRLRIRLCGESLRLFANDQDNFLEQRHVSHRHCLRWRLLLSIQFPPPAHDHFAFLFEGHAVVVGFPKVTLHNTRDKQTSLTNIDCTNILHDCWQQVAQGLQKKQRLQSNITTTFPQLPDFNANNKVPMAESITSPRLQHFGFNAHHARWGCAALCHIPSLPKNPRNSRNNFVGRPT